METLGDDGNRIQPALARRSPGVSTARALAGAAMVLAACVTSLVPEARAGSMHARQLEKWSLADVHPAFLPERLCSDGRDDDQDGLADCADGDCVADAACVGGDFDGDGVSNATDCAPLDPGSTAPPSDVPLLRVTLLAAASTDAVVSWDDVASRSGSGTAYDVVTGRISRLWLDDGPFAATLLVRGGAAPSAIDVRLTRVEADGFWYLVRTRNSCAAGTTGSPVLDDDPPFDESPTNCADGLDNDGDGATDCADAECTDAPACFETCDNGVDDDADGRVDCDDVECIGSCPELGQCANGVDDDGDGAVDCDDSDCATDPACCPTCSRPLELLPAPTASCQVRSGALGPCASAFYAVPVTAGQCVQFSTCACGGSAAFDAAITIHDAACTGPVATPGDACDDGGTSTVRWTPVTSGTVVVEVWSPSGGTGRYDLSWSTCNEQGSCADGADNDDDLSTDCDDPDCIGAPGCPPCASCPDADPIPPPTSPWQFVPRETTAACPEAFFRTTVVPGQCYELTTCWPGSASGDSIITVLGVPDCAFIFQNDDSCMFASYVRLTIPAGVTEIVVKVWTWPAMNRIRFNLAYRECPAPEGAGDCADGLDNDEDALVDCRDPGCNGSPDCPETGNCADRLDNDLDGSIDCADTDCANASECCPSCAAPAATLASPTPAYQTIAGTTTTECPTSFYAVPLTAGSCVELTTCAPGSASQDSTISLLSPSCVPLAANDDACGTASRLIHVPTVTGMFRVSVTAAGGVPMNYVLAWRTCAVEDDPTECSNGIDDDFDGDIDCTDAGCAGIPPC